MAHIFCKALCGASFLLQVSKMQAGLFFTCVLLFSCVVDGLNYRDCGSTVGTLLDLNVSGCDGKEQCPLKRGTDVEIVITYRANDSIKRIKPVVKGKLSILPAVPFNGVQANGCQSTQPSCPLNAGDISVYRNIIPVKSWYPTVSVEVHWALEDEQKRNIVCVKIPSKIEE
ncbi:ecdysteroid-regulated 16 kDa protein-like [Uloborus diversus]|uniref:ecdysteroid-regulated 16 kDa protein-like n=1 Tax=Uloborus diversus TaxID=327109 RepID=UPI002409A323|nr:ecdysteroid-regulated 16 kDa protein-like [Uloborus diversus]